MDEQKQSLIDRIKQAQNILVSVSTNPSVDQLAAAIGLTIALNKLDKHGTAVFSGQVPDTIDFLKPEDTLEKNTDSLRDFIIALDKSKADKLRYKVEDQVVRIFITPYKTSLSEKDLEFSQGDFNVDVVVGLGVTEQQDLDAAITAHGRILHDATVASVSTVGQGSLGSINWVDPGSSSLSEMVLGLVDGLDKKTLDSQIATALLTGIVATTDRFRNEKTSPRTMSAAAELMAAGANQQLIATELEPPESAPYTNDDQPGRKGNDAPADQPEPPKREPGTLEIDHGEHDHDAPADQPVPEPPQVQVDEEGQLLSEPASLPEISQVHGVDTAGQVVDTPDDHARMTGPPRFGDGDLTANSKPEELDPSTEELTLPPLDAPLLSHNENVLPPATPPPAPDPSSQFIPQAPFQPAPQGWQPPAAAPAGPSEPAEAPELAPFTPDTTLEEIEESVDSPHLHAGETTPPKSDVDDARNAVEAALNSASSGAPLSPVEALNAQPLGQELHNELAQEQPMPPTDPIAPPAGQAASVTPPSNTGFSEPTPGTTPADDTLDMPLPSNPFGPGQNPPQNPLTPPASQTPPSTFPGAPAQQSSTQPPPPVPPPMLPPLQ